LYKKSTMPHEDIGKMTVGRYWKNNRRKVLEFF
jgi:hypothetical protein